MASRTRTSTPAKGQQDPATSQPSPAPRTAARRAGRGQPEPAAVLAESGALEDAEDEDLLDGLDDEEELDDAGDLDLMSGEDAESDTDEETGGTDAGADGKPRRARVDIEDVLTAEEGPEPEEDEDNPVIDDGYAVVMVGFSPDDIVEPLPVQKNEFTCRSCFLVLHVSRDDGSGRCRDCA